MKKFLKKANRGLILGGILIAGVTVYVIADLNKFKEEKPLIQQTITEYADAVEKFNITPEKYREYNLKYNKEDAQKLIAEFNTFTDEYWLGGVENNEDLLTFYYVKNDFKNSMNQLVENQQRGYITEFEVDLTNCRISKDGPDAALVTCTANIFFVGTENSAVITPTGYDAHYTFFDDESPVEPRVMQTTFSQECTFFMERKSADWKITKCETFNNYDINVSPVTKDSKSDSKE